MTKQQWKVREQISKDAEEELNHLTETQRHLLWHRGVRTKEAADVFIGPDFYKGLHDPFLMLGMERAVERILLAIKREERVVVYADYDCDGIPGSVVLNDFFEKIGYKNFEIYIPHRHREGYGLNSSAIKELASSGCQVLITVDNGITDVEQVKAANTLGIDVIITDHHEPPEVLPSAYVILNPKQKGETYPFRELCGSGVAFKLVQALIRKWNLLPTEKIPKEMFIVPEGWEKWLLDVVGLATIADMVPLVGENRVFATYGLKVLKKTERPGLSHLIQLQGISREHFSEDDVGFSIGPVINAASRLGEPRDAFLMLSLKDYSLAAGKAEELVKLNNFRKKLVKEMVHEAVSLVEIKQDRPIIVVGKKEWKPGLLGLAASALVEKFGKPTFVWGMEGSPEIKGSCRSDGVLNIVELMRAADGAFSDVGGHEFAGGFSCTEEQIERLEQKLMEAHRFLETGFPKNGEIGQGPQERLADLKIVADDVTWKMFDEIAMLGPFGVGNLKPVFLIENAIIASSKMFGKEGGHLQINLRKEKLGTVSAIKFFSKHKLPEVGDKIDLLCHLEKSTFGYRTELRLRIIDIN